MALIKHTELTIPLSKKEIPQNIDGKVLHSLVIYLDIHEMLGKIYNQLFTWLLFTLIN